MFVPAPDYLDGTFLATRDGFFASGRADFDPHTPDALARRDPWDVLYVVMERAKRGDFSLAPRAFQVLGATMQMDLWDAAVAVAGYIAPAAALSAWVRSLQEREMSADMIRYAAEVLEDAGGLWTIPRLLELHAAATDELTQDLIQGRVAALIEPEGGPLHRAPPSAEFRAAAAERHSALMAALGAEGTVVRRGLEFDVIRFTENMLAHLRDPDYDDDDMCDDREVFEAATGVDCREFYSPAGHLQRLTAAAILEDYLAEPPVRLRPGVRYFFGHRVPAA